MSAARTKRESVRPRISDFARRLLHAWVSLGLPCNDAHIVLATSGGADSVALLLAIDELLGVGKFSLVLTVAHLDHSLRTTSRDDALWVGNLANRLGHNFVKRRTDVKKRAVTSGDNLEQAARTARYEFLMKTAKET